MKVCHHTNANASSLFESDRLATVCSVSEKPIRPEKKYQILQLAIVCLLSRVFMFVSSIMTSRQMTIPSPSLKIVGGVFAETKSPHIMI